MTKQVFYWSYGNVNPSLSIFFSKTFSSIGCLKMFENWCFGCLIAFFYFLLLGGALVCLLWMENNSTIVKGWLPTLQLRIVNAMPPNITPNIVCTWPLMNMRYLINVWYWTALYLFWVSNSSWGCFNDSFTFDRSTIIYSSIRTCPLTSYQIFD